MDRDRYGSPLMARQRSNANSSSGESPVHPAARQLRAGAPGAGSRRAPNYTAKAAAARLAQAMASQSNDDEEDDEPEFAFPKRLTTGRAPSPLLGRNASENATSTPWSNTTGRTSMTRPPTPPSTLSPVPSNRSRPPPASVVAAPPDNDTSRFGRFSQSLLDDKRESASLHDKIDQLEEEKEELVSQLRAVEDKCKEADARAKQLEKQVANLGEGVSLEARLISRKEAALKQREAKVLRCRDLKETLSASQSDL
ncbi:hypothetical protein L7F22_001097 [Adiantum nelumboides]|nr:hypothetical protein [Adiantum nelumboides]